MLYCLQDEFYFFVHCLGYVGHDLHKTQTYQNLYNFGHSCCICHLLAVYDMVYICIPSMLNFSTSFWQCIGNSRNVQVVVMSYKYYAIILRQIISVATCAHRSIFLQFLWYLYCCELSSLSFDSDHLHEDEIVFVLQIVEWIAYFIISVFCMYEVMFAYLLSFSFFHICLCVIFLYGIFHFFPFLFLHFWRKFRVNYIQEHIYRYIVYYCVIFCLHIFLYTFFVVSWDIFSVSAHLFLLSS